MDNEKNTKGAEILYSAKVKAGKRRTYFFDVKKTKGEDFYITLTESTRRFDGNGFERHKIFLYKEDFNRFVEGLQEVVDHIKNDLMPDYDYDEFARRYDEDDNYTPPASDNDSEESPSKDEDEISW